MAHNNAPGEMRRIEHQAPTPDKPMQRPETGHDTLPTKETERLPRKEGSLDAAISSMRTRLRNPKKKKQRQIPQVRDEMTVKIENIMESGLKEAFAELPPVEQQEFKIKGEQVASEIRTLLKATHIKVKKIFKLLVDWLKMLPGINRFFLEQEAKIKTDKIISLKHRQDQP